MKDKSFTNTITIKASNNNKELEKELIEALSELSKGKVIVRTKGDINWLCINGKKL